MEWLNYLWLILAGLLTGFINVIAGGGSLISLPLLIFLGLPPSSANATNRLGILAQNIFSVLGFRSKGVSAWPYSLHLGIAASLGAILGARISLEIPEELFKQIIASVMVLVVISIVLQRKSTVDETLERMSDKYRWAGYIAFFFIGIYGGFIQAGTGFLIMAALTGINRFSLVKTNSAKVLIALVYTIFSIGVFIYAGAMHWQYALILAIGNATGGWFASRWSVAMGDVWIKRILVVIVFLLAIKLWFYDV